MSTNREIVNHTDIADEIYEYLRYEYKFLTHKGMTLEKCKSTLANKLKRLSSFEVMNWNKALDEIAKTKSDNAPTPVEIIYAIKAAAKALRPVAQRLSPAIADRDNTDYEALWKQADNEAKWRFFIDHKFNAVPPYIRYWFIKHHMATLGYTAYECTMLIKYWAIPFNNANAGAVINNQREITEYFRARDNG